MNGTHVLRATVTGFVCVAVHTQVHLTHGRHMMTVSPRLCVRVKEARRRQPFPSPCPIRPPNPLKPMSRCPALPSSHTHLRRILCEGGEAQVAQLEAAPCLHLGEVQGGQVHALPLQLHLLCLDLGGRSTTDVLVNHTTVCLMCMMVAGHMGEGINEGTVCAARQLLW